MMTACPKPETIPTPPTSGTTLIDTLDVKPLNYIFQYNRNQIILDYRISPNGVTIEQALIQLGFQKITCPCQDSLALFTHPSPATMIETAAPTSAGPRVGGIDLFSEGLLLNTVAGLDPFKESLLYDEDKPGFFEIKCPLANNKVKIGIVDSGVDSTTNIYRCELLLSEWRPANDGGLCYNNDFTRGVTYLFGLDATEPDDHNGHGTSVNGVVSGTSYPNVQTALPFDFVNVRFTQESTKNGTLFDAMCASYYALKQNTNIINISWGIAHHIDSNIRAMDLMDQNLKNLFQEFLVLAKRRNILVVAGLGNDSLRISNEYKFYPACLAKKNPHLISVGALNSESSHLSQYTNWSHNADSIMTVAVRGDSIITTYPKYLQNQRDTTGYRIGWGTSFAAPMVSRLAGLLKAKEPELSASVLKRKLLNYTIVQRDTIDGLMREYLRLDIERLVNENCH